VTAADSVPADPDFPFDPENDEVPPERLIQHRHKIFYRNNEGVLLQLTFDVSDFQILPDHGTQRTYWLEIENNDNDPRARMALTQWAGPVTERLGAEPASLAKSELAAELAGWVPAGEMAGWTHSI
jgi:hypothetical protein